MGLTPEEARELFAAARVARLATADTDGVPHVVPVVFAVDGAADAATVYSAVDAKPKRTTALRRLANIRSNPRVALLADHYDDTAWDGLWWVRADGVGRVLDPSDPWARHGVRLLVAKYPQYVPSPPDGPVLAVDISRWTGWVAAAAPGGP
ncbi:MAG: TIGR03668 family PPOX class F420-dependent oxidoreductase [Kineosporiaceae bacterium]